VTMFSTFRNTAVSLGAAVLAMFAEFGKRLAAGRGQRRRHGKRNTRPHRPELFW
jgi:hypothetical protein